MGTLIWDTSIANGGFTCCSTSVPVSSIFNRRETSQKVKTQADPLAEESFLLVSTRSGVRVVNWAGHDCSIPWHACAWGLGCTSLCWTPALADTCKSYGGYWIGWAMSHHPQLHDNRVGDQSGRSLTLLLWTRSGWSVSPNSKSQIVVAGWAVVVPARTRVIPSIAGPRIYWCVQDLPLGGGLIEDLG